LNLCYSGYTIKNVGKSEALVSADNNKRLKSIYNNLSLLQNLHENNLSNNELPVLVTNTNQIYQSLLKTNSPSPLCLIIMKEELRQFESKTTELQTLLEPTELW
jgi:hypothetical protein